jgi:hypothetical protein
LRRKLSGLYSGRATYYRTGKGKRSPRRLVGSPAQRILALLVIESSSQPFDGVLSITYVGTIFGLVDYVLYNDNTIENSCSHTYFTTMASFATITVPAAYGFVIVAAGVGPFITNMYLGGAVMSARTKCNIQYPNAYGVPGCE